MAISGKQYVNIGPARREPGTEPIVRWQKEASVQTGLKGCPVAINASGFLAEMATNGTALYGFAMNAQSNGASDGAASCQVARALPGIEFGGTLNVTSLDQSHLGLYVTLIKSSSTWAWATTVSATNALPIGYINGWDSRYNVGDAYPEVFVIPIAARIQGV